MLDKFAIARALREVGLLLEVKGENPFKVRAYEAGARALEDLPGDLGALLAAGRITETRGIGEALAKKIAELHRTGRLALLEELRAELPPGILDLLQIPDLGPRKIAALRAALGIAGVEDLKSACAAGRVRAVKGFGERSEQKILEGIRRWEARDSRLLLSVALEGAEPLLAHLRASPLARRADVAGSLRRWKETVGDLDLVAASDDPVALADHLAAHPSVAEVLARGEAGARFRLGSGLQVDLRVAPAAGYPALLHHLTGSKAHHVRLRGLARDRGYTLSEWGLVRLADGKGVPLAEEADVYRALGMPWVPPELREDQGEVEAALEGRLPEDLVRVEDVRGMVHCHTDYSDGRASIEEMALAAEAMGMEYLTITDHSPSAAYAGGVRLDRLEQQWEEMARVQERVRVRLLRGTESDILEDGALDYPDAVLERMDVVIASIHSRMKMGEAEMTRRLVRAMRLPIFKIWGHASGRLLGEREPYACRVEEVLDAIAASRAAVEVNGDPHRLDLEPRWIRLARERGIRFVVSTDAHAVSGMQNLRYGVATARRGWLRRSEVLNTLDAAGFARAVRPA